MVIKLPLPWYSKSVYDVCNDEMRGGWRFMAFQFLLDRALVFSRHHWGFKFTFRIGLGAWFV